jgi:type III secretion YscU/HrpY family protein
MAEEKTEEPTPKKLREARKRGEVAKSREVSSAALLLATAGVLLATGDSMLSALRASFSLSLTAARGDLAVAPTTVLGETASLGLDLLAPLLAATVAVAALSQFLQIGPLLTLEAVSPKLERLDPIRGAKNLLSQRNLVELLKAIAKLALISTIAWVTLEGALRGVVGLAARDALAALEGTGHMVSTLLLRVGGALAGVAVLDVLYQRWRYRRDQGMTKEEVKREHKEAEGDPHVKRERQRVHHEILAHNALEAVRDADVLVVNPTRLAVALRYDEEGEVDAPEVVAKGQDELALRMRRAAEEAGVPIMRDVPLARALFELEIGDEIPEALYEAVAVVLRAAWAEREGAGTSEAGDEERR